MFSAIKAYFETGKLALIGAGILAVIAGAWRALANAEAAGRAKQKAEEGKRYAEDVDKAARADRARDDVLAGRVQPDDKDPYRRD